MFLRVPLVFWSAATYHRQREALVPLPGPPAFFPASRLARIVCSSISSPFPSAFLLPLSIAFSLFLSLSSTQQAFSECLLFAHHQPRL